MSGNQPTLPTLRDHDLPPFWDGFAVVWDGWETQQPAFICPPPKATCCRACGSMNPSLMNRGRMARSTVVTHQMIGERDVAQERLPWSVRGKLKALALYSLVAFRCLDCRFDQVLDREGRWWDLDESDYMDAGSYPPANY